MIFEGIYNLLRWVILAYVAFVIYRFFRNLGRRKISPKTNPVLTGTMVKDEFCGTYISKDEAIREVAKGKEYYFCSKECRAKFLERTGNSR